MIILFLPHAFCYSWLVFFLFGLVGIGGSLPYIFLGVTVEPKATMAAQQISRISTDPGNTVTAMIRVLGLAYIVWGALVAAISVTAFRRARYGLGTLSGPVRSSGWGTS